MQLIGGGDVLNQLLDQIIIYWRIYYIEMQIQLHDTYHMTI